LIKLKNGSLGGVVTKLSLRKVIHIEGGDTYEFLNGMVTNKIERNSETDCVYAAFLNHKGRLLADALLYHRPSLGSYMIELSVDHASQVVAHLEGFKMRKKVYFDKEFPDTYEIYSILATNLEWRDRILRNLLNRGDLGNTMNIYVDPRYELSIRVIVPKGTTLPLKGVELLWAQEGQQREYDYLRMINGIPEGQKEMPYDKQVPLEANIQHMNGINFNKGCYIGQELIARTHFTGQIRKRILPLRRVPPYIESNVIKASYTSLIPDGFIDGVVDVEEDSHLLIGKNIYRGEAVSGTVLNGHFNVVMGVVRMEHLKEKNLFSIDGTLLDPKETSKECWQVITPPWWSAQKKEIE
jgi:folate-binding protein YgfZ